MNKAIKLIDSIEGNLTTILYKLKNLKGMLDSEFLSEEQIRRAIKTLQKPIKHEEPYIVDVENPIESGNPLGASNPFYRNSVGGEELNEDTQKN